MNLIEQLQNQFTTFLLTTFGINQDQLKGTQFVLNVDPGKQQFGDINANAAMVLAKELKKKPQEIAQKIVNEFTHPTIEKIEIAGPGFLNIFLTPQTYHHLAKILLSQKSKFFAL